ncbi:MAG: hypothetical protein GWN79_01695, partial [Actinobacteria bacterium]|nr:hypothetical protein [Actinomycetota bacterium]NIT94276.1 hypothetical protein [Actinomycetota bacterium]NIU17878.1 hypothetical protein [Actinomycetota bacterium]NIU64401.1 hypothetical protein [Actinomycetota bacterium]NIV54376.1 hypothetical protein [Actinomycetota bacterium]
MTSEGKGRRELERDIGELHRVETHAAERRLALTAALEQLDDGGVDGAGVTRARTKMSSRAARRAARTASQLARMPGTAAALAEGRITVEHAEAAADAAERTSPEAVDAELVDDAAALPADRFARRSREWAGSKERLADQQARHDRQRSLREARTGTGEEGMRWFLLRVDPTTGAEVEKTWQEEVERLWRDDGGRDGTPDEIRTPAQR